MYNVHNCIKYSGTNYIHMVAIIRQNYQSAVCWLADKKENAYIKKKQTTLDQSCFLSQENL